VRPILVTRRKILPRTIPDAFNDLFEKKTFAQLATIMPDGTPQVTPVWCEFDGTHVVINSAKGRTKDRNMRRNPNVALSIQDPEKPYRHLSLKGKVVEITENGADAHIDNGWHGAFTYYFCKEMRKTANKVSRAQVLKLVRTDLAAGHYPQIPELECEATVRKLVPQSEILVHQ
jgi:PPOX class probable F420-dependent enzyme